MPIATIFVAPELAIAAFAVSALISLVTVVPRAWRQAEIRAVMTLVLSAFVTMPAGVWLMRIVDETALRLVISLVVIVTLVAMMAGWRHAVSGRPLVRVGVGAATGILGAATGLMGPIVILFNLGSGSAAAVTRANTLVFLTVTSLLLLPQMAAQGVLTAAALWLGLLLLLPYGAGSLLGQRLFDPARERLYRGIAYAAIAIAALLGLPIFR
jgi:uncharacterized membrane protein YfcA